MKILQVVDDFPPKITGDGLHVYHISKELAKRGHDVTVFTMSTPYRATSPSNKIDYRHQVIDNVKVYYFQSLFRISYFSFSYYMCRALLERNFDLIHVHRYFSLQSPAVTAIAKFKRKPIVFTPHSTTIREKKDLPLTLLRKIFDATLGHCLLQWPALIIALTNENVKDFLKQGVKIDKIKMIPNGIDIEKFRNLPEPSKFKERFRVKGKIVLFVGRLVKYKGVQYILHAAPKILNEHPEAKFVIVGPDYGYGVQLYEMAKQLGLRKSVIFTGLISESELLEAYAAADVFAFPSIHEGFGLVLLEAMACEKPVVTWKTSAMQYIVENGKTGFLVNPFNVDDFANSICLLLSDDKLSKKIGKEARKIVEKKFQWKSTVDMLENVYKEVVATC
ncbi:hypothetical protein DRO69_02725 [Candidatus Bathyarchaeota archaeon]|nr:MAG: hypothetical protein DRO69_02725 [Candidatus Bathyarchaeota archaeon]